MRTNNVSYSYSTVQVLNVCGAMTGILKRKLRYFDLLLICCTTSCTTNPQLLWICCTK